MDIKSIEDRVKEILATQTGSTVADIGPSTSVVDDLGADSLDEVEIIMALEDEFEIEIPDDALAPIKTVSEIVAYITSRNPS